jgi:hypothetical protein
VLTGQLDASALYGVLAQIEALGLDLIEVRQLEPDRAGRLGTPAAQRPRPRHRLQQLPRQPQRADKFAAPGGVDGLNEFDVLPRVDQGPVQRLVIGQQDAELR